MNRRSFAPLLGLTPFVLLLAGWQVLGPPNSPVLPPPSRWLVAISQLQSRGLLLPPIARTTTTFLLALVACVLMGGTLGILLGSSPKAQRALGPILDFLRTMPHVTAIPIVILLVGINLGTTIIVVVFAAVWPIFLNTTAAMRAVPPVRMEMARSLSPSRLATLYKVVLPSLAPRMILGFRVAAPICLVAVLVVDIISADGGIGTLLAQRQATYDAAAVFAITAIIGALGLALNIIVAVIERTLLRNRPEGAAR